MAMGILRYPTLPFALDSSYPEWAVICGSGVSRLFSPRLKIGSAESHLRSEIRVAHPDPQTFPTGVI